MTRTRLTARRRAIVALAAVAAAATPFAVYAQVSGFRDVPKNHWAADSIDHLVTAGILQTGASGPFAPVTASDAKQAYDGDRPVTRYELAVTLYRFVEYIERANKQPRGKLPIKGQPKSGPEAVKALIAAGYLPADSPLAADGSKPVTAKQYATALGQVIVQSKINTTPVSPDSDLNIELPSAGKRAS